MIIFLLDYFITLKAQQCAVEKFFLRGPRSKLPDPILIMLQRWHVLSRHTILRFVIGHVH